MNKVYLIFAMAFLAFTSCKQNDKAASEMDDTYAIEDTTAVEAPEATPADTMAVEETTTSDKEVKLADTISVKTTRTKFDTSGKFALANTKWRLVELNGKNVPNESGKPYVLTMNSKTGKITGYAGCNSIMGSYLMKEGNSLNFLNVGSTKMACPEMKTEEKFMKALSATDTYMIEGNMLHIHKGNKNKALAKFEAIP